MEHRSLLVSAVGLGVGVGLGLGLGLASARWRKPAHTAEVGAGAGAAEVEAELRRLVVDGRDSEVTFHDFHHFHSYLSEQTKEVLMSAAFLHLNQPDLSRHIRNLSAASRAILLTGPSEPYLQSLAKALSHHYMARLLLLDVTDFSLRIQRKYGSSRKSLVYNQSVSKTTFGTMSDFIGSFMMFPKKDEPREPLRRHVAIGADSRTRGSNVDTSSGTSYVSSQYSGHSVSARRTSSWSFDDEVLIKSLYKVMVSVAESGPVILYIRDVDRFLNRSQRTHSMFQKMLDKLSGKVLILGSLLLNYDAEYNDVDDRVSCLFPYHVDIEPPEDEIHFYGWVSQMEEDAKKIQIQDNRNHIVEVLSANDLDCDDLSSICQADPMVLSNYTEEIIVSAASYHFFHNKDPEYKSGKLLLSSKSLSHGLSIFQESGTGGEDTLKMEANGESKELPDNEFEKRIRSEVIPASEIGVTFDDIGALDDIKESLQELVMLPLLWPDLFKGGGLLKPCRGILLFGPPGTGKTMLAKAIANDAGASFINVSMSTITSKWFGEDEKNVRALFSLAAKVAPTIIFIDEVDSMLGQRARYGEHEAMRKIKNEFMSHWDGILSKSGERVLVLAATNRPFDLDEAIIRRFERRIMVGLPTQESRELILRTVLSKEKVDETIEYKELASMTEGYSGSDLKNLCMTAAYCPVRELLKKERLKEMERRKMEAEEITTVAEDSDKPESKKLSSDKKEGSTETANLDSKGESSESKTDTSKAEGEEEAINLRPLTMEDLRQAKNQVAASFAAEGAVMNELKQWNDLYGEGGSRKKQQLTYFL